MAIPLITNTGLYNRNNINANKNISFGMKKHLDANDFAKITEEAQRIYKEASELLASGKTSNPDNTLLMTIEHHYPHNAVSNEVIGAFAREYKFTGYIKMVSHLSLPKEKIQREIRTIMKRGQDFVINIIMGQDGKVSNIVKEIKNKAGRLEMAYIANNLDTTNPSGYKLL